MSQQFEQEYDDYYDDQYYQQPELIRGPSSQINQEVMELQEVKKIIDKTIELVKEQCYVDQDNAIELLIYYDWREEQMVQKYFSNQEAVLQDLKQRGIFNDHCAIKYQTDAIQTCPVCLDDTYLIQLGCKHRFCKSCIEQTIYQKIKKEHSLIILCLLEGCKYRLPFSMIQKFSRPEDLQNVVFRKFVENSPNLAYCTGVDCKKILRHFNTTSTKVVCTCGNEFCFRCKSDFHPPAPCDIVKKWIQQVTKDEANIKWIAVNTKICPFCKKPVERSSGCNQLHCKPPGGCGQTFCYVCSNPWEPDHRDHFKCSKYVPSTNNVEKEKELLARYNFYYERFLNSQQNYEQTLNRIADLNQKGYQDIHLIYEATFLDCQFLEESLGELLKSRKVLKWSYCLGYFVQQSNEQSAKLFDNYQEKFEHSCEQLAISIVKFFDEIERLQNQHNRSLMPLEARKKDFLQRKDKIKEELSRANMMRQNLEFAIQNGQIDL